MTMIEIGDKDFLRSKLVEPAWYHLHIEDVTEAISKDGGSTNWLMEATIVKNADNGSTEFTGVPVTWNFNSKAPGFAIGFFQALGENVEPGRYDLESAKGKDIEAYIKNDTYQGRMLNRVEHQYRPVK